MKIFSPLSISFDKDYGTNIDVELFGMRLANSQGVPAPKLIANGVVEDKYCFRYIIMEYINGKMLDEIEDGLSYEDKVVIGQNVRKITDKLNIPCENFTNIDFMQYAKGNRSTMDWDKNGFPESLQKERSDYLENLFISKNEKVYCHGDFHCQNILVDDSLNVYIVDFADAMYAPVEYELVYVVSALFCFEEPYMTGYFGEYKVDDIVDLCMTWLPIHAWGHATTEGNLGDVAEIKSFADMREKLYDLIKMKKEKIL
jgi:aminoglycoside phosphotransferase (APT) family kinase protein